MPKIREVLICATLVALTCLLVAATAAVCVVAHVAQELPKQVRAEIAETRSQLLAEVDNCRLDILEHFTTLEKHVGLRLDSIEGGAHLELREARGLASSQLSAALERVDLALADLHGLREDAAPALANMAQLAAHADSVAKQVDETAPLFLDCQFNPSCAYNRFQGASKAVELAAQNIGAMSTEVRGALPPALLTWQRIGSNVDTTAGNVARITKPHFYDQLFKGFGVGAAIGAVVK